MGEFEIIRGAGIMMGVVMVSFLILNTLGPLADEIDYRIYRTSMDNYPKAESTLHTFHDTLFYTIIVINLLTVFWFVYSVYQRITYSRVAQVW